MGSSPRLPGKPTHLTTSLNRTDMTNQDQGATHLSDSSEETADQALDPRRTDHPTGAKQAAENAREESPS